jgi:hypothetical protein
MMNLSTVVLPQEFLIMLKESNATQRLLKISTILHSSTALSMVLEKCFAEIDEHKIGVEKMVHTLGWDHFRDRLASVYIYKNLNGVFPDKTDMSLVEAIRSYEKKVWDHSVAENSRAFLLAFYVKMLNMQLSSQSDEFIPVDIPTGINRILNLSKGRSEKIDWLILIAWHFYEFWGEEALEEKIKSGCRWRELYGYLSKEQQFQLVSNLLAYGASIQDDELFLFERI